MPKYNKRDTFNVGDWVQLLEEQVPYYSGYAGNPTVLIPVGSVGVIGYESTMHSKAVNEYFVDFKLEGVYNGNPDNKCITWRIAVDKLNSYKVIRPWVLPPEKTTVIDVSNYPVMKKKCPTCPFNTESGQGFLDLVGMVTERVLTDASQICHHPALHGKEQTHICRGGRDVQLIAFHAAGIISEPTDAAWAAKWLEVLANRKLKEENCNE